MYQTERKQNKKWSKLLIDYVSPFKNNNYLQLDCGHNIHACKPKIIAKEIENFITALA